MNKARPKYPTDLNGNIYIDNIQKAVAICLIIRQHFFWMLNPLPYKSVGYFGLAFTIQVHC
jgi:hypothetical protein